MRESWSRRKALAQMAAGGAGALLLSKPGWTGSAALTAESPTLKVAGLAAELAISPVSARALRVSLLPLDSHGQAQPIPNDLVLVASPPRQAPIRIRSVSAETSLTCGAFRLKVLPQPLVVIIQDDKQGELQRLQIDLADGSVRFPTLGAPIFGLGEGGPQLDRRGHEYSMKHGQATPDLATDGARVAIPWLVGAGKWALFFHLPYGSFDLTSEEGRFRPWASAPPLPLDLFLVASRQPQDILAEYARLTGFPHLPPIWSLGYQQSHRTLADREEVMSEARKFRDDKLPCDVLIYLGTGFCPSGWNQGHGSFTFNSQVFPDPERMFEELHREHFKVALHVVNPPEHLHGRAADTSAGSTDPDSAADYWSKHLDVFRLGVDGWWADEGDSLDSEACLVRNRMYWEGPQLQRPNVRPYTLNRNGYAGMQRYGWLWSGDIDSTWEALRAQVPVGINTGLSGMPYWGTDTGGFITTPQLAGELYVRWFQFSAFCPLFRSHGRTWKLRRPWQWNTGDYGPIELKGEGPTSGLPDIKELHNPQVEPICRKYLDLRYTLLPYTYTLVREAHDTGLPLMRALWLHYADDPRALACFDQYLWGRDVLVAPVTQEGANNRTLYLPRGTWYDFWTNERMEGGREISRPVDLATMPLYVRAGAILPFGPVKQYATEQTQGPLTVKVYPGVDGEFTLYEDDGVTFDFLKGETMWLQFAWRDRDRRLAISLRPGSKMRAPRRRTVDVTIPPENLKREIVFEGNPVELTW
jgi:alpha-glucosidase (family GH31 glycosyl hydrolase)